MAHFSVASLFQIGLLFILICWTRESTAGAAFSLEEEFKQFKIQMKEIVKSLESKVTELESEVNKLNAKDSLLTDLLLEKNERTAAANHFESAPMRTNQSAVASINGLPSSCGDLKMIGHTLNGFYSIAGSTMIESVYCDFNKLPSDPDFQKWIGYVDVKSTPVHFYVQRNSTYSTQYTPIPWDLARVNEGNAMNLTSGIFTAPRPGIYFFSFTGLAYFPISSSVHLEVGLYLNGGLIGSSWVNGYNPGAYYELTPLTVQSTMNLKSGDQVWVAIYFQSPESSLYEYRSEHNTHFTGWILEEDIVASL